LVFFERGGRSLSVVMRSCRRKATSSADDDNTICFASSVDRAMVDYSLLSHVITDLLIMATYLVRERRVSPSSHGES
jgi:hypothetical protein